MPLAPRTIAFASRAVTGVEIHPAARIGADFFIDHGSGVVIGETAEIGDRVTLYQGVTLGGTGFARGKRHPTIEDDVTIGSGAKLLGPVNVGHGAKVGANTVVIEDVPANSTVVGNPGHPVRVEGRRPEGPDADWIHLPDPIADAIKALSERIGQLEGRLAELDGRDAEGEVRELRPQAGPVLGRRLSRAATGARRDPDYPRTGEHRGNARGADRARRRLRRAPARRAQPRPARGRHARRGPAAGPRRAPARARPARSPTGSPGCSRPAARARARSWRSPSPTRRPARCASASRAWSAASRGRCG